MHFGEFSASDFLTAAFYCCIETCPSAIGQYIRENCFKFHLTLHYLQYQILTSDPTNFLRQKSPIRRIKINSNWLLTDNFGKWTVFTQTLVILAVTPSLLSPWLLTLLAIDLQYHITTSSFVVIYTPCKCNSMYICKYILPKYWHAYV